jgi:hypothetical protein
MKSRPLTSDSPEAIWQRVLGVAGTLPLPAARAILRLRFSDPDLARMRELSAKARAGTLSPSEEVAIDTYERLGCLLDILHSKARRALRRRRSALFPPS